MYKRVLFIGSKELGLGVLKEIFTITPTKIVGCVTVDDRLDLRSKIDSFINFCKKNNMNLNILSGKCDLREIISIYKPDLCIVVGWYYIIPEDIIYKVKGGFIGVHNSLLPAYRGFAPVVWSMLSGDSVTGFSVFSFDSGMDTGEIWYQEEIIIEKSDYISDVLFKINERVISFFHNHYVDILRDHLKPQKQSKNGISYGAKRTREDGRIDWNKSADEIYNFIRAQSKPYPGAYTVYKGQEIIIWKANVFPYNIYGEPGQVILSPDGVVVSCGDKTGICIEDVEVGGRQKKIDDIIKGLNYRMT